MPGTATTQHDVANGQASGACPLDEQKPSLPSLRPLLGRAWTDVIWRVWHDHTPYDPALLNGVAVASMSERARAVRGEVEATAQLR